MRFSIPLAVTLTAAALAAPIRDDECGFVVVTITSTLPATTLGSEITSSVASNTTASALPVTTVDSVTTDSGVSDTTTSALPATTFASVSTDSAASDTTTSLLSATTVASVTTSSAALDTTTSASPATTVAPVSTISAASGTTTSASTSSTASSTSPSSNGTFQFFGVNESGGEFGTAIPGVLGTDYIWPDTSAIQTLMQSGMNIFRIPHLMERLAPGTMTSALDQTYLSDMSTVVNFITSAGGYAVVDAHNFGRYDGSVITSTSDMTTYWTNVATAFATNDNVIFDCNNEFHDEPTDTIVASLNQACIDGVRAAGATTQYIFVEGTSYTGAWTWTTSGNSANMGDLTDPSDKIVYEMHQYLDSDGSGTSDICVSSTIGAERVAAATAWLQANNKKAILGEYAGGANSVCESAVEGMLDALAAASDVWMGAIWWGGGPWWGDYIFSMEPPSGTAYVAYKDILAKYI